MESNDPYQVEFLYEALCDMSEIVSSFVMLGSKNGAIRIREKMSKAAKQAACFPYSGVSVPYDRLAKQGYRMIIVEKYLMFYRVFDDEQKVIFYRVLNGTRDYPNLLKRIIPE